MILKMAEGGSSHINATGERVVIAATVWEH